uniref:HDC06591 n=1 Tax=Drosophila melanogaster TaxID=7227 RepID=Q6IGD7_DROME|nr:TPA_inf: HDC06591 [Drosophila melanogaster]
MGLRCVNQRPMKPGHRQSEGSMLKKIIKQADSTRQHQDTRTSGHQDTRRCRKVEIGWRDGEVKETGMSVEVAVWQVGGRRRRGKTTSATSRVIIPAMQMRMRIQLALQLPRTRHMATTCKTAGEKGACQEGGGRWAMAWWLAVASASASADADVANEAPSRTGHGACNQQQRGQSLPQLAANYHT